MPSGPVLYWRDPSSKTITLDQLISSRPAQVIEFESTKKSQIESIQYMADENTVEEPEISTSGIKSINKQNIGALPESLTISGNVDIIQSMMIRKLRSFARKAQTIETDFEYGIFGFYSNVDSFFDVDPNGMIGYTIKPPTVSWNAPQKQLHFTFRLLLGGRNLT